MADRRHHIGLWVQRFGHLQTLALSQHIALLNDQLHQWRETLSASACNHRRNALTNLVKVLYGRRAAADLIDLVRFAQPPPKPRWLERSHHRSRAGAVDAGVQDRSTLAAHALDGDAAVTDGPLAAGTTSASTSPRRSLSFPAAREGGWQRYRSSAKGWRRPATSPRFAPMGAGPAPARTKRWSGRPGRLDGRRSPCTRFATRSRRGYGGRARTWRTSRTCTGTRTPRQR